MSSVHEALGCVQRAISHVGKDSKTNAGGTYNYRGIDAVINALHPLLGRYGVVIAPTVVKHEVQPFTGYSKPHLLTVLTIDYHVYGPDGDQLVPAVRAIGYGLDATDKGPGKAMSYAYKTAIGQLFSLPTDDPGIDNEQTPAPDDTPHADPKFIKDVLTRFESVDSEAQTVIADWLASYNTTAPPAMTAKDLATVPGDIVKRLSQQINKASAKAGAEPF